MGTRAGWRRLGSERRVRSAPRPPRRPLPPATRFVFFLNSCIGQAVCALGRIWDVSGVRILQRVEEPPADSLPRRCERLGFDPGASLGRGRRTGARRRQPHSEGRPIPSIPKSPAGLSPPAFAPEPYTGNRNPLEFVAPLQFLGTGFFGLCWKALACRSFKAKALGTRYLLFRSCH